MNEFASTQTLIGALTAWDLLIVAGSVAALFVIAYAAGRRERDTRDFFLGSRRVPALIACLSFVATEVSAVSIIANPATGYAENLNYLQFFIGSAASKLFVAFLFIPVFYTSNCTSIYEFLRHRFGPSTQYAGSIFFFISRLIGSGVRLYAACMAVAIIFGGRGDGSDGSLQWTLAAFTAVSIAFIAFGGIKAVVWTGAYETAVFYLAGGAVAVYIICQIGSGWGDAWHAAAAAGRLSVFNFTFDLNNPTTFWAGAANAFFVGLAVFGTDQELVQRLLTVETRKSSQRAMLGTILAALPTVVIYLGLGTLLFMFYHSRPQWIAPQAKSVLPQFIVTQLPAGLKGLMLAAIILASIDSPLSSLSSSFVSDIYRPLIRKTAGDRHYLWVSRASVAGFGLLLIGIALACIPITNILWFAFQMISITGGSMLGIFLLGLLTRRPGGWGNVVAMIVSAAGVAAYLIASHSDHPPQWLPRIAWTWLIVIGTATTFTLAYLLSPGSPPAPHSRTVPASTH